MGVAIGETVILLTLPLPLVGVSIDTARGCQQNDSSLARRLYLGDVRLHVDRPDRVAAAQPAPARALSFCARTPSPSSSRFNRDVSIEPPQPPKPPEVACRRRQPTVRRVRTSHLWKLQKPFTSQKWYQNKGYQTSGSSGSL